MQQSIDFPMQSSANMCLITDPVLNLCRYGAPGEGAEFASQAAGERECEFSHGGEDECGQKHGQTAAAIRWDWAANT